MIDGMYKVRRSLVNNFDCMGRIFIYIPYIEDSTNEKLISWRVRLMIGECSFYGFDTTLVAFSLLLSLDRPMDEFGRNKVTVRVEFMNINRRLYLFIQWILMATLGIDVARITKSKWLLKPDTNQISFFDFKTFSASWLIHKITCYFLLMIWRFDS